MNLGYDLSRAELDSRMPQTPQPTAGTPGKSIDFFISRTGADSAWAQWIAWQLEANGYSVVIQDWDFGPGVNFVHKMQQASTDAERTIAVLSPRYFQSSLTEAEWTAVFYRDATAKRAGCFRSASRASRYRDVRPAELSGLLRSGPGDRASAVAGLDRASRQGTRQARA